MTNTQIYTLASLCCAFAVFLVWLNLWYRNARAQMTRAERDEEDRNAERW
jgi:hypothetical protein